jgi:hypothetical protein
VIEVSKLSENIRENGDVLSVLTPGAATSTAALPKLENRSSWSCESVAATHTTLARSSLHG